MMGHPVPVPPGEGTVVPSLQSRPGPSSKHNDVMSIVYLSVADVRKPACL